jgi:hypothetical protein
MLCLNNVLGFQNFRFIITSASLSVTHLFKYELRSTNIRNIMDFFILYPYDRWEIVFERYKIINGREAIQSIFNGRIMEAVAW